MPAREDLSQFIEQFIPFNKFLGMQVGPWADGSAEMTLPARAELTGDPFRPAIHGGVIASLADATGGLAVFSLLDVNARISTVDMRVDFLRPGKTDQVLRARARVLRMGNRVAVTDIQVFQDDPASPVAEARAVYNISKPGDS